jgi:hypothetical protein
MVLALAIGCVLAECAFAQTAAGEVNGIITDSSGAGVPAASVKLTNQGTKITDQVQRRYRRATVGANGVQRAALMRLLGFSTEKAISLIKADSAVASGDVGTAVINELGSRTLFPFLVHRSGSAAESVFPSVQGTGPMVSPDGKWVSFISNLSGVPQVWVVPAEGGYPRMVTNGEDPVTQAQWSPASNWIAITIAPGGGLNTQVYVVRPDGSGMKLLTQDGKDNNSFNDWTEDGKQIAIDSNRNDPASRDSFMVDVASGETKLLAKNPGIGSIDGISRDGKRALLSRLRNRGDNNLYLLDLSSGRDTLITKHDGVALFSGEITPDGSAAYIGTNKDRDLFAFARIKFAADGTPGPIEILAERQDGELDALRLNKQGSMAALIWNVKGRNELSFYDLVQGKHIPSPKLPGELAGGLAFSHDGSKLALNVSGAGNTAIKRAIVPHAASLRVCGNSTPSPHSTSATPDRNTSSECHGRYGGIIGT